MSIIIPITSQIAITTILTGICMGLGIMVSLYIGVRLFIREVKKEMPNWIISVNKAIVERTAIQKALRGRK